MTAELAKKVDKVDGSRLMPMLKALNRLVSLRFAQVNVIEKINVNAAADGNHSHANNAFLEVLLTLKFTLSALRSSVSKLWLFSGRV